MAKEHYSNYELEWLFERFLETGMESYFLELITRINPWLFRMIYRITGDREAAKDVLQDTWLLVLKYQKSFDSKKGNFRNYIYQIGKREAVRWTKNNHNRKENELNEAVINSDEKDNPEEIGNILRAALEKINNETHKNAIILHYFAGMKINEIAETMNTNQQNIKNWLMRGRKTLEKVLNKHFQDESFINY
ncbi:MAG: RNA polymerase sigma factor [Bacteroidetes bacterium]|nr:RNA polymerase sigma factor [Bacteroidota bacterium]